MFDKKSLGDPGKDLMYLPLGEMLTSIAKGLAEAQFELDKVSMATAEFMGGERIVRDPETGEPVFDEATKEVKKIDTRVFFGHTYEGENNDIIPQKVSMIELGFVPNFYHFVDTVINIKVALKVSKSEDDQYHIQTAPVDAHYASTYNYNLDFAASVQTKIVPIPPPTLMEERLRLMAEMWQRKDDLKIVNGIGAKMEYYLNEAGIKTLKKLSEAKKEDLDNILKKEGLTNPDRYGTANWPEQAELAYQGKWSELRDLQEKSEKDNLKKIPGLGAKSEEVLNTAGIKTYEALSKKSGAALRKILDEAQVSKSIDPSSWPEEAAKLDREKKG